MTTTDPSPPTARALGHVGTYVDQTVATLQRHLFSAVRGQHADALGSLARLRRAAGNPIGEVLDALEFALPESLWVGDDAAITRDENAAHLAMTLYAVHQQSKSEAMHRRGRGLGAALRLLDTGPTLEPVRQRFRRLGTADSFAELSYHLRGAIALLRARGAPLDYGLLADELVAWQSDQRSKVQLAWGRGFYRSNRPGASSPFTSAPDSPPDIKEN